MQLQHTPAYGVKNLAEIIEADKGITEKNLDGDNEVSMTKGSGLDEHTVQNMCFPGIEFNPAKGEKLVVTSINGSESYMVAIAGTNEKIAPDCLAGERRIFSVSEDGDTLKSFAKFKNTGVIELNGNDNFAVLYNELKVAFDQLKSDHDDLVSKYNLHIHPVPTATALAVPPALGITSVTATSGTPSTADMSPSKSLNVLLKSNP